MFGSEKRQSIYFCNLNKNYKVVNKCFKIYNIYFFRQKTKQRKKINQNSNKTHYKKTYLFLLYILYLKIIPLNNKKINYILSHFIFINLLKPNLII